MLPRGPARVFPLHRSAQLFGISRVGGDKGVNGALVVGLEHFIDDGGAAALLHHLFRHPGLKVMVVRVVVTLTQDQVSRLTGTGDHPFRRQSLTCVRIDELAHQRMVAEHRGFPRRRWRSNGGGSGGGKRCDDSGGGENDASKHCGSPMVEKVSGR